MLKLMLSESPIGLGMLIVQDFNLLETIICKIDSSAFNSPTNISFLKTASPIFSMFIRLRKALPIKKEIQPIKVTK